MSTARVTNVGVLLLVLSFVAACSSTQDEPSTTVSTVRESWTIEKTSVYHCSG